MSIRPADDENDGEDGRLNSSGNGPHIYPLEMDYDSEEELDSLVNETADISDANVTRHHSLRKRHWTNNHDKSQIADAPIGMLGILRSQLGNALFSQSYARALAILAAGSFLLVFLWNGKLDDFEVVEERPKSPHDPSLGGSRNSGHYHQSIQLDDDYWFEKMTLEQEQSDAATSDDAVSRDSFLLPTSNVGEHVPSFTVFNEANEIGHYRHDPEKSPYASPLYANDTTSSWDALSAHEEQLVFEAKMAEISKIYGRWKSPKYPHSEKYITDWGDSNKDVKGTLLQADAMWQADPVYLGSFLDEAKQLVRRVKEGIYASYGFGLNDTMPTDTLRKLNMTRLSSFRVIVDENVRVEKGAAVTDTTLRPASGVAYLNVAAWEALVRKLLHGMMTMDQWYVVTVGNANTYAGNNFEQSAVMQFNDVMEPVFDKLGMKLISRNMGMNATTSVTALGGADIVGEADILWYIPDRRESVTTESMPMVDLLHKQAFLSGERVPVILSPLSPPIDAMKQSAWFGNIQPGAEMCPKTSFSQETAVKACRFIKCANDVDCNVHNSVCWVQRKAFTPSQVQDENVGNQNQGYPNQQQQKLEGSKLAMLVLHALDAALDTWSRNVERELVPLPDALWHVGPVYAELRDKVRTAKWAGCDQLMRKVHPSVCHVQMHAYTEWTPRVNPFRRLKSIVKSGATDDKPNRAKSYLGIDLWPKQWRTDDADIDVHMIAIAAAVNPSTTGDNAGRPLGNGDDYPPEWNNDNENGDGSVSDTGVPDNGRRLDQSAEKETGNSSWIFFNAPVGRCDGSAQSQCNRIDSNTCYLSHFNHFRAGILAHGQSGKLSLSLPNVKEGIVIARFEWELENGPRVRALPSDFNFTTTVNGSSKTMGRGEFAKSIIEVARDLRVLVLMMKTNSTDPTVSAIDGKATEIDLEVHSTQAGVKPILILTHIYYA